VARYSALKIRVFQACRLRYRYQYVDRVKPRLRPADTAGSLVHRVLCDFYSKIPAAERSPDRLVDLFEAGWAALAPGYHRIPGVERYRDDALRQLHTYIEQFDWRAEPLLVEPYFQVELGPGITLFGRIDRIDELPGGDLHVIDYKGGALPGDVDPGQLVLYAIMAERQLLRTVARISFWYLDDGSTWTRGLSEGQKAQACADITAAAALMQQASDFPPTIASHCGGCPFLHHCEVRDDVARRRAQEGW
jgi:RecB family exonuclease